MGKSKVKDNMRNLVKKFVGPEARSEPTLRTVAYSACVAILVFWMIALTSAMMIHISLKDFKVLLLDELWWLLAEEMDFVFNVIAIIILPLVFILPQVFPKKQWRIRGYLTMNVLLGFCFFGSCVCNIVFVMSSKKKDVILRLESLIIEFLVSVVSMVSIAYLLWNHRYHSILNRVEKTMEYFEVQGTIHGCEILLVATSVILASLIECQSSLHGAMTLAYSTMPYYLFFSLLLIQVRHYTYVHNDHLTPDEARDRTKQFLKQYHMNPLERELVNSKSWHQFLMEFLFTSPVYPQARCGVKDETKFDAKESLSDHDNSYSPRES